MPSLTFRTAFIVGHPGETDAEFEELARVRAWARSIASACFAIGRRERRSSSFGQVPAKFAAARCAQAHEACSAHQQQKNRDLVGSELEILVEGPSAESSS